MTPSDRELSNRAIVIGLVGIGLAVILAGLAYFSPRKASSPPGHPALLGLIPGVSDAPPLTVYIFTSDDGKCYLMPPISDLFTFGNPGVPYQIVWTGIGNPHSYTLTLSAALKDSLGNKVTTIPIPTGASSSQYDASVVTPSGTAIGYTNITRDPAGTQCLSAVPIGVRVTH